jgi:hypothetical protein
MTTSVIETGRIKTAVAALKRPALLMCVLAYYLYFSWDRVHVGFAADEMMNMGFYFRLSLWRQVASWFLLWKNFYRPMGAAFYMPLFSVFGLHPRPFQIAVLIIMAVNICLLFALARNLGCGDLASGLAAFAAAYPANLANIVYNTDMVYDVLCFLFYVSALVLYVRTRRQDRLLRGWEMAGFFVLYLCALNSKEMAPTMPLILLAYEAFYHPPVAWRFKPVWDWLRGPGRLALFATALNLVYVYGKCFGADPIIGNSAYRPVFSLARIKDFQKGSLYDLLAHLVHPGWHGVLAIWILVTYLAWRRNRPVLRFCWAYMLLTPIPIEFLAWRFQGCLYIPLAGWAIFASVVFLDLARAGASFLAGEPIFRRLGRKGLLAILVAAMVFFWAQRMSFLKKDMVVPGAAGTGVLTANVLQQMRALNPKARPNSTVIFLNDPFVDWDMSFIGVLWFHDRSITVLNGRKQPLPPEEVARMDQIFDFQNGRLVRLK